MTENKSDYLLDMFVFELNRLSAKLESILLESEASRNFSTEHINEIFRIVHTIKGSAAMMEKMDISSAAHYLEDLFFYIREERPAADVSAVCDLVFMVLDYVRLKTADIANGTDSDAQAQEDEDFLAILKAEVARMKNIEAVPTGKGTAYKATVFLDDHVNMVNADLAMVVSKLIELWEDANFFPQEPIGDNNADYIMKNGLEVFITSELCYYELKNIIEDIPGVRSAVIQKTDPFERRIEKNTPRIPESPPAKECSEVNFSAKCSKARQNIISVNKCKLDRLVELVGEIATFESTVINSPDLDGLKFDNFHKSAGHLQKHIKELQTLVLSIRMMPISMVFGKMNRIVRDMGKRLDKAAVLEVSGGEIEVDKSIIDHLSDPLMHLVRNCMDHGIESREERVARGNPPVGKITLEAEKNGQELVITVSDDGAGLNRQRIINKAKMSGLLSDTVNPTDRELCNFILLPGFSTKEEASEFSGRGVGMDVVKENIKLVRGSIYVDSVQGEGTVFTIKIHLE